MEHSERFDASGSNEGRFRMLIDAITDYAIYMLDPDGTVTSWNPGARRFKGYEESEIIGENFSRFYTEEDRKAGLPAHALEVSEREGKFESEGWRVRKDGSKFWAYVVIDPIRDNAGRLIGFAKITRDLTERRQAEVALRESQEQFRLLVQGVTDYAIFMLSSKGYVSSWNSGAQRIKGYAPEEIIGQHFSRFYTEEDRQAGVPQEALEIATREGRFEREGWRVRKDGTQFFAHVLIDAIYNPDGSIFGFAKITRDITERMNAARSLEEAREALFQSQKMEAIGHLTGGVAHDFNNLLMAIQGSLELLQRRLPRSDPKVAQLIDNALQGTRRGAALTQRMLAFARRQELKLAPLDVRDVVQRMTNLLQSSLGPSIRVETQFPARTSRSKCRRQPARTGASQSGDQWARRDAERRDNHDRRDQASRCAGLESGKLSLCERGRHRHRHGRRNAPASDGAILHDKRRRQRHGPWTANGSRNGRTIRRETCF